MTPSAELLALVGFTGELTATYRDKAHAGAVSPYGVLHGPIASPAQLQGDGTVRARRLTYQLDVWHEGELPDLERAQRIADALDGVKLEHGLRARVGSVVQVPEPATEDAEQLTHHALTIHCTRLR